MGMGALTNTIAWWKRITPVVPLIILSLIHPYRAETDGEGWVIGSSPTSRKEDGGSILIGYHNADITIMKT